MPFAIQIIGTPYPIDGQYLKHFDFDADNGLGFGEFTDNIQEALLFDNAADALEFWRTPSTVKPLRLDGKPNRPLTSTTVHICEVTQLRSARGDILWQDTICTCTWSAVNTATFDPPYITATDPDCPRHGIGSRRP
jgi:hypothetical protein